MVNLILAGCYGFQDINPGLVILLGQQAVHLGPLIQVLEQEPVLVLGLRQLDGLIDVIEGAVAFIGQAAVITAHVGQTHNLVVLVAQLVVQVKGFLVFPDFQVGIV